MGEAHLLHVGNQIGGDIPIAEKFAFASTPPGTQVALVDVHGPAVERVRGAERKPVVVAPLKAGVQIVNFGGHVGTGGSVEAIGIALAYEAAAVRLMYGVLVGVVAVQAGEERLPDATLYPGHRGGLQVPVVEIANDGDLGSVGGPNPEQVALGTAFILGRMGAETLPGVGRTAFRERFKL